MADSSGNSEQKLNLAALLRAAADDELCSHDERRLEAFIEEDPSLASCIECDQKLREAISRAFCCDSGDCAPKNLRDCVQDAMRCCELEESTSSVPEALAGRTRSVSFWQRTHIQMGVAAAAMVLIAGVLFFYNNLTPVGPNQTLADRTAAASYVASEHGHCITDAVHAAKKLVLESPEELPEFTANVVGSEIAFADLAASGATDVRFVDAGKCHVPGGGPSMHLRFQLPDIEGESSLFIQRDSGRMKLSEGITYTLAPSGDAPNTPSVYMWLREGFVYYLVIPGRAECDKLRKSLVLPTETRNLTDEV
ncbi:MAG: hypothetical protein ACIARQ_01900 [Phycisphaerales bacterium JB061]